MKIPPSLFSAHGIAILGAFAMAAALSPAAQAQITQTVGAGTAITGAPDRFATFDSVVTGTDLTSYSENSLFITTPKEAYTPFDPTNGSGLGGFSGGFSYPGNGVLAFTSIRTTDAQLLKAMEFNVGTGYFSTTAFIYYRATLGATLVGSGAFAVTAGSVLGFSSVAGFDRLDIGAAQSLTGAQGVDATSSNVRNGVALDNVKVRLAGINPSAAPEPGSLALLLPVMGTVGILLRRRKK